MNGAISFLLVFYQSVIRWLHYRLGNITSAFILIDRSIDSIFIQSFDDLLVTSNVSCILLSRFSYALFDLDRKMVANELDFAFIIEYKWYMSLKTRSHD